MGLHWGDDAIVETNVDWVPGAADDDVVNQKMVDLPVSKAPLVGEHTCWLQGR